MKNVIRNILENKVWYHGSDKPVRKFLFSKIGKSDKRISNYYGYGIYFIDVPERAKYYGDVINKVVVKEGSDILKDKVTPNQLLKVYKQLVSDGIEVDEKDTSFYLNPIYEKDSVLDDVEEFYDWLLRYYRKYFKDIKGVTVFLLRAGIDGMELVVNEGRDTILVIFNQEIIKKVK